MTVRGNEISVNQLVIWILGAFATIIGTFIAYYMKDMSDSMKMLRDDVAVVKVEMRYSRGDIASLRSDQDDLRNALYQHMIEAKRR